MSPALTLPSLTPIRHQECSGRRFLAEAATRRPAPLPRNHPGGEMREGNSGLARNRIVVAIRHGQHPSPAPSGHPLPQGARGIFGAFSVVFDVVFDVPGPLRGRRVGVCAQGATGQGWPVEGRGDRMSPRHDPEHTPPAGDRHRRCRRSNRVCFFWLLFLHKQKQ